jgi:hypothetical protein
MATCPKCFQEKPILSPHCPHCTQRVEAGDEIGFAIFEFILGIVLFGGFFWFLGALFG